LVIKFSYEGFTADIQVIRSKRKTVSLTVGPEGIIVRVPLKEKTAQIESFVQSKASWIKKNALKIEAAKKRAGKTEPFTEAEIDLIKEKARQYIPQRAEYYARLLGVDYAKITVRSQRTRWGSCTSTGNLSFNCLLMLLPEKVIDSVVVHELCHRKHMNHSSAFYAEIARVFPDYAKCRLWLKDNGSAYLARLPK